MRPVATDATGGYNDDVTDRSQNRSNQQLLANRQKLPTFVELYGRNFRCNPQGFSLSPGLGSSEPNVC
jgi:hypothetical protein